MCGNETRHYLLILKLQFGKCYSEKRSLKRLLASTRSSFDWRISDLGRKWVKLPHVGTNLGEPKCDESDLKTIPRFVPFGAKLILVGPKSGWCNIMSTSVEEGEVTGDWCSWSSTCHLTGLWRTIDPLLCQIWPSFEANATDTWLFMIRFHYILPAEPKCTENLTSIWCQSDQFWPEFDTLELENNPAYYYLICSTGCHTV